MYSEENEDMFHISKVSSSCSAYQVNLKEKDSKPKWRLLPLLSYLSLTVKEQ